MAVKSGEGGLGNRREGVVGEVGVCVADGLRGALGELCCAVFATELLRLSDRSTGEELPVTALLTGVLELLPDAGLGLFCPPVLERVPFWLRKW